MYGVPAALVLLGFWSYNGNQPMPHSDPVSILIVNEQAEEIKLATISLRGFFPDCRIDVAYSSSEAIVMASSPGRDWSIVLIDSDALPDDASTFTDALRRHVPYAAFLLQSSGSDAASALRALRIGADYFLSKHSPAFLTELLFCVKESLDKRDLRLASDLNETRYRRLVDSLGDAFYELDAEGRFLRVNAVLASLLGYRPDELIGTSYSTVLTHPQPETVRFRLNERRSGPRATTGVPLTLQGKRTSDGATAAVSAEVTARGLYDPAHRFLGTIGIIRDLTERTQLETTIRELRQQEQRSTDFRTLGQQLAALAENLRLPLSALATESAQLFEVLSRARLAERAEELTRNSAEAARLGERLEELTSDSLRERTGYMVGQVFTEALTTLYSGGTAAQDIETDFSVPVPPVQGDRDRAREFFQHLITYAQAFIRATGRHGHLTIRTGSVHHPSAIDGPTLFPLVPRVEPVVEILESDRRTPLAAAVPTAAPVNLTLLYGLAKELGVTLDVSAPASGPFRIQLRLPVPAPAPAATEAPAQPSTPPAPSGQSAPEQVHAVIPPAQSASADRRQTTRVTTTLHARINIGSSSWDATLCNISVGGACIELPRHFPSIALQEAYVIARTAAGILELGGLVYERPAAGRSRQPDASMTQLVLVFQAMKAAESAVLASMLDAVRERTLSFTLELLLAAGPIGTQPAGETLSPDLTEHDRREAIRIPPALPARLETAFRQEPAVRLTAQVVNISRTGACIVVNERPDRLQGRVVLHFAPAHRSDQPTAHEPSPPETALSATIVWVGEDQIAPSVLRASESRQIARIGIRFQSLSPYAERELFRLIRQYLGARPAGDLLPTPPTILSVPRECRNARGHSIALMDSHLRESVDSNVPTVILAPGYGQTALDYAALAYYLAAQGLRVLRYDHTNHLGNSDGELQHFTLRSMQHDLFKVVEFVRHTWPQAPVVGIASDLTARAALKSAAQSRPLNLLILVNPSVDVGAALMAVHGHDLVADYQFGLRRGITNLLGLNVNIDQFIGDLIAGRFTDLESTLEDLRPVRASISIVTSPAAPSASLPPPDLPHALLTSLGTPARLVNLPTPLTDQEWDADAEYPASFKLILELITSSLPGPLPQPARNKAILRELVHQRRVEEEYTRFRHDGTQVGRDALCAAHMAQLHDLGNLHEYRKVLDDLYGLMSPIDPGAILIDAGIGEKDLTRATLINHTYRGSRTGWSSQATPIMVGLERSHENIVEARQAVQTLQRELSAGFMGRLAAMPPLTVAWILADWTESLPFETDSVHRMISNLSFGYVPSPLAALREWYRVLHPEGRLIFTAFLPTTDLSSLYRSYLRQAHQDEFSDQAQPLLHYFGRLREGIRHHVIYTFDRQRLSSLFMQCGITSFEILPIYDGQALAAVVRKRNSSSPIH